MECAFWLERWRQNQIGFHGLAFNEHLQNHWPALRTAEAGKVFVPLCGKSRDMLWLMVQGYQVVGAELSPLAVRAFFAENGLSVSESRIPGFSVNRGEGVCLYCGDFFQLAASALGDIAGVWDRAALVALPPKMRVSYAERMRQLLNPGTRILLVTFDYPQLQMQGPPFCVPTSEVLALYGGWCDVELLNSKEILDDEPHFRDRGLSRLQEQVYRLTVR